MSDRGYVGKHRQERATPVVPKHSRAAGTKKAVTLALIGTVAVFAGDVGTPGTSWTEAAATHGTAVHTARTHTARTHAARTVESGDLRLGRLTVHFDATGATTTTIAGDDLNRRLSWTVQVTNKTGDTVTIGDPTAILWATDGSGHVAMSRQRVRPGSRRAATVSFELPKVLEPSSITLTLGSDEAAVSVQSSAPSKGVLSAAHLGHA